MSQLMPTIQIINGQPVLQAKVQHVVTSNGPMTVAVLPADIGNFLRPFLQQQHPQLQFPSLQSSSPAVNPFLINMPNHVLSMDKEQMMAAATVATNHKKATKRQRSKRPEQLTADCSDPSELKIKAFPRIQPKLIEPLRGQFLCSVESPSFIVSSLAAAQMSPPPAAPASQKQITIRLNDEEQRSVESLSEQIARLSALPSLSSGQEELLRVLEQKRRSLLEQAALKQMKVNAVNAALAQQKQQQVQAQAQAAFVRSQGFNGATIASNNNFVPSVPLPLLSGSSIPQQQLVHINGTPFLLVQQPKTTNTTLLGGEICEAKVARHIPASSRTSSKGGHQPSKRLSKTRSRIEVPNNSASQRCAGSADLATRLMATLHLTNIRRQLVNEQTAVVHPNCKTPFADLNDAVTRLLPYHIYSDPDYSADLLQHVDTLFQKKAADLIDGQKILYRRLQSILLKRAAVEVPNEEQALIDQLLSSNEAELLNAEKELLSSNPDDFYRMCEKWKNDLECKRARHSPSSPLGVIHTPNNPCCCSPTPTVSQDGERMSSPMVVESIVSCVRSPRTVSERDPLETIHGEVSTVVVTYETSSHSRSHLGQTMAPVSAAGGVKASDNNLTLPDLTLSPSADVSAVSTEEKVSKEANVCVGVGKNLKLVLKLNNRRQYTVQSKATKCDDESIHKECDDVPMEKDPASPRVPPLRLRLTSLTNNDLDSCESVFDSSSGSDPECSSLSTDHWRIQELELAEAGLCDRRSDE
ncbi:unnamed protein product [Soboliphyme baturini]|uniref:GLTSCR1 domain-containing protein n=1 Tax=Soboliphyme baturini TaxID=241478 RepID=A0A183J273_9BILA|nr:unnamed protein product [Soboliphyme baturini]